MGTDLLSAIDDAVVGHRDTMVDIRRTLHRQPELSFAEHATTALVRAQLEGLGFTIQPIPLATGVVADLVGGRPGPTVVVRADIDALPVVEATGLAWSSAVDGVMHACGHDAHTAIVLGVAAALAAVAEELPGRHRLIFQPAEEQCGGGRLLVDAGVVDEPAPVAVLGCHVTTAAPVGVVATRPAVLMAGSLGLRVVFRGAGGHGALQPEQGNVVLAAARLAAALPGVVGTMQADGTACVASPGHIVAGTAPNVVPVEAVVEGTIRTFDAEQQAAARRHLDDLVTTVADDLGVTADVVIDTSTGPVRNDPAVTALALASARRVVGPGAVELPGPVPASDDVSAFLERRPGCYLFVGAARDDGRSGQHHSPTFDLDEGCLVVGARMLASASIMAARGTSPTAEA